MQNNNIIVIKFVIRCYHLSYDNTLDVKNKNKANLMRLYEEKPKWTCVLLILTVRSMELFKYTERELYCHYLAFFLCRIKMLYIE